MKVLVVFATALERDGVFPHGVPQDCDVLVSGVGMVATAVAVSRQLALRSYAAVLQLGIAGAYPDSGLALGTLVRVERDCLVELGVEEANGAFTPWERPELGGERCYTAAAIAVAPEFLRAALAVLPGVSGATVLRCTGTPETARARALTAQIESMEGAACLAAAAAAGVPALQVRAISNWASTRDFHSWKIPAALAALQTWVETWNVGN